MQLPMGDARRRTALERLVAQHDVDIQRLWRLVSEHAGGMLAGDAGPGGLEDSGPLAPPPWDAGPPVTSSGPASSGDSGPEPISPPDCCVWMWNGSAWVLVQDVAAETPECHCRDPPTQPGVRLYQLMQRCCEPESSGDETSGPDESSSAGEESMSNGNGGYGSQFSGSGSVWYGSGVASSFDEGSYACFYSWSEQYQEWTLILDECGPEYTGCPVDPGFGPGAYDGEVRTGKCNG